LSAHGQPSLKPSLEPAWKQEVARRLAAHKNRKGTSAQEEAPAKQHSFGNSVAAQAAARVAARYAKAPSYSEMQSEEARLAVRAAEIATKVALEAQAVAEEALAEMHAAAAEQKRGPGVVESITRAASEPVVEAAIGIAEPEIEIGIAEPESKPGPECAVEEFAREQSAIERATEPVAATSAVQPEPAPVITQHFIDGQHFGIRWESDAPVRVLQPKAAPVADPFELDTEDWWTPAQVSATLRDEPISVESDPGTANLIEFPREIVATRKMRPRLIEPAQTASAAERQLSIFEVDPGAISTEPEPVQPAAAPAWSPRQEWLPAPAAWSSPQVSGAKWSGMELDEHPLVENRPEPQPVHAPQQIHLATLGRRLMAMSVDGCLILAGFFGTAMALAARMQQPVTPRGTEALAVIGLVLAGLLYNAVFFTLGVSTPGMRYAGIALSTFDDEVPTRAQLRRRLGAMVLSLAPVGLGLLWSVFDEDHLSWHDRISQTYLRKR
jgi:uncharacterized RDD family membrane protein YckC